MNKKNYLFFLARAKKEFFFSARAQPTPQMDLGTGMRAICEISLAILTSQKC